MDLHRPFRYADAVAAGISPDGLRGPRFRRLFHGVYVDASVLVTPALRIEAALLPFGPEAWASHASAARMLDLPIPTLPDEHVSVPRPDQRRRRTGIKTHVAGPRRVRRVGSVRISDYADLFVELAGLVSLVDLVAVGDAMVRRGWITPEALRAHCASSRGSAARAARQAAAYVRGRVDSPMETRLRMLLVLAGLPEPGVNLTLRDAQGRPVRRHDLTYRQSRLVIEYDGRHHIEREGQWEADLTRREAAEGEGWRVIVVVARDIYRDPEGLLTRIHQALLTRGEPGVPASLAPAWRPHFATAR